MNGRLTFGEWLDDELRRRRWSHAAFADSVGVGRSTVTNWVNNVQPPRRRACRDIAKVLGLDVNEVLVRAGYPPADPEYVLPEEAEQIRRLEEVSSVYDPATPISATDLDKLRPEQRQALAVIIEAMLRDVEGS